jgi:glycosyltransferase involved in cell wall biosynthesis
VSTYAPSWPASARAGTAVTECAPVRVALVSRREPGVTGTSRYAASLSEGMATLGVSAVPMQTGLAPGVARLSSVLRPLVGDVSRFLATYPVRLERGDVDLYHLTAQNLATLLVLQPFDAPVVVTVHDIIPYLLRRNRQLSAYAHLPHRWFDALAVEGLKRADALLAVSGWTKRTLIDELGIPAARIHVVHSGVDATRFQPLDVPAGFYQRYRLAEGPRYVLYVGSEDPRKNLDMLFAAFGRLRHTEPDVRLLKVGAPQMAAERSRLLRVAAARGIEPAIDWIEHVPDDDLPYFYNLATVCVLPSLYEGFGFPALEAMACGTPLVCADAAALPEVGGGACVLCPPTAMGLYRALRGVVNDQQRMRWLSEAGQQRAAQFTWQATAEAVSEVYRQVVARTASASRANGLR